MAEKIEAYKAKDGSIHENEQKCIAHESRLAEALFEQYISQKMTIGRSGIKCRNVLDFIIKEHIPVLKFLETKGLLAKWETPFKE